MRVRLSIAVLTLWVLAIACSNDAQSPYFGDVSPVTIEARSPADGATAAPVDRPIEVEFSGAISTNGIANAFHLYLGATTGAAVPSHFAFGENDRLVQLIPNAPLAIDADYTAVISQSAQDAKGRPLAGFSWSFHTVSPAPTALTHLVPAPGHAAPVNFLLRAEFDQKLAAGTVSLVRATVVTSSGGSSASTLINGIYDADANAILFRPPQDAPANALVAVMVSSSSLTDTYGRPIPSSVFAGWNFSTTAAGDYTRPSITGGAVPAAAENPSGSGTVVVTLPAMTDDSWLPTEIRWEATFAHKVPPFPAGCADSFDPDERRVAVIGSSAGNTLSASGLTNGLWTVTLIAEDGSGRRSIATAPKTVGVSAGAVTFDGQIAPIFQNRCSFDGCHKGSNPPGFLDTTLPRDQIIGYHPQNPARPVLVSPYCLSSSYLWWVLVPGYDIDGSLMPPDYVDTPALTREEREAIAAWIQQGAN